MPPLDYLLVPGAVTDGGAALWIGTRDLAAPAHHVVVEHQYSGQQWTVRDWRSWQSVEGTVALRYARLDLSGLAPATSYPLTLRVNDTVQTVAEVTTLPRQLPPVTEPAFTVLLGSCFFAGRDGSGRVGQTYTQLSGVLKPSLKLLVGDQVYLDNPWYRYLSFQPEPRLVAGFLRQYWETWAQHADRQGFHLMLRSGANYFCADDHEFWNNAPFASSFVVNTWTTRGRETWWSWARALYRIFQTERTWSSATIGDLAVCVIDTRLHRTRDRSQLMRAGDMERLATWVDGLDGPGLLALSQPIFVPHAPHGGRFADWTLADFGQYGELCRILLSSRQSLIVAAGDLHFGRIARAPLPSGAEIIEVVSSPMSLVDPLARGTWTAAPAQFPAGPIPGLKAVPVTTDASWRIDDNHFVTMAFNRDGAGVRCRIEAWPTTGSLGPAPVEFVMKKGMR